MVGLGTIINVAAVIMGGLVGKLFGKAISKAMQDALMTAIGISVIFIGIGGVMEKMLVISDGKLSSSGGMMIIGCLVLGAIIGELLKIEESIEKFGAWLKEKTRNEGDTKFIDGFVTTSITISIGAMAVVGALQDGMFGDYKLLVAKSVIDFLVVLIMTSSMGIGCAFSAIPVGLFQGIITLAAKYIEPFMTTAALSNLSLVGSILIFCVGLNLVVGKKIKVANLLPGVVLAVIWTFLPFKF